MGLWFTAILLSGFYLQTLNTFVEMKRTPAHFNKMHKSNQESKLDKI